MDLYSSDLRLSDIGLDAEERENLAREYPLGILDEEEDDSGIYNPYSPGSSAEYEDTVSSSDMLSDMAMHQQVVDDRGALMEIGSDSADNYDDGILDVLNTTATNLHWIDSFLQSHPVHSPVHDTHMLEEDLLGDDLIGKTPRVKSEHSYSLARSRGSISSCSTTTSSPLNLSLMGGDVKLEEEELSLDHEHVNVEDEEHGLLFGSLVEDGSSTVNVLMDATPTRSLSQSVTLRCVTSLDDVKPEGPVLVGEEVGLINDEQLIEYVKVEPNDVEEELSNTGVTTLYKTVRSGLINSKSDGYGTSIMLHLPPTPPHSSSCSSSDSESSLSPSRSPSRSPPQSSVSFTTKQLSVRHNQNLWTATIHQPAASSAYNNAPNSSAPQMLQGGSVGTLYLTEEEKRTMLAEGYPLPAKLPLTKQEEKNLKKIRRKIKNKISAQESRRKKKEYLETLEKKVEVVSQENNQLKKKVDILETNNRSLISQLQRLQTLVNKLNPVNPTNPSTTTTCVLSILAFNQQTREPHAC